jgi:hypothetical protein
MNGSVVICENTSIITPKTASESARNATQNHRSKSQVKSGRAWKTESFQRRVLKAMETRPVSLKGRPEPRVKILFLTSPVLGLLRTCYLFLYSHFFFLKIAMSILCLSHSFI